jgi:predicted dehydrogenase
MKGRDDNPGGCLIGQNSSGYVLEKAGRKGHGGNVMIGVGIVGAGFFGEKHAEAISILPEVRLVAATRTNQSALGKFVERFGGIACPDYRALLEISDLDAVVIATPHHLHTDIAVAAAKAHKHILLEKPMAHNLAECDQILQAVAESGVKLMVGHINQFAPSYKIAKALIESGEVGEVVLGVSTMSKFWFEPNRRSWHLDRATGGGMWLTAGLHCLDRLTWLVGSPVQSVSAQFDTRFHDQNADDVGLIFLRYANGAAGTVVSTGYKNGAPKHLTELTCTRGMLNITYDDGVRLGRNEQWQTIPESVTSGWMEEAMLNQWRAFIEAIENDTPPAVSGDYARHIMAAVFAAEESSNFRHEVAVAPP